MSPIKNASGNVIGASRIGRDITERKQAQKRQELLTQEIHYRTKNIFSVVQAVVSSSFADKRTVKEAEQAVLSRLHSLAQTHVMLIDKEWQGADMAEVVRGEMSPYAGRCTMEGPPIVLNAKAAQNFALAVHELATNAVKHGALSNQFGRVHISWSVGKPNGHHQFQLHWREQGGPQVSPPSRKGFGSTVLEQVMADYFETPPQIEFAPSGVRYEPPPCHELEHAADQQVGGRAARPRAPSRAAVAQETFSQSVVLEYAPRHLGWDEPEIHRRTALRNTRGELHVSLGYPAHHIEDCERRIVRPGRLWSRSNGFAFGAANCGGAGNKGCRTRSFRLGLGRWRTSARIFRLFGGHDCTPVGRRLGYPKIKSGARGAHRSNFSGGRRETAPTLGTREP